MVFYGLHLVISVSPRQETPILWVLFKHTSISINSCEVKSVTGAEVESGCMEVDKGEGGSSSVRL